MANTRCIDALRTIMTNEVSTYTQRGRERERRDIYKHTHAYTVHCTYCIVHIIRLHRRHKSDTQSNGWPERIREMLNRCDRLQETFCPKENGIKRRKEEYEKSSKN